MTSPITYEKIIEVLRDVTTAGNHAASQLVTRLGPDFVEDYFPATTSPETALSQMGDIVSYDFWVIWSAAMKARDLYQRLQAEKEGGAIPILSPPAASREPTAYVSVPSITSNGTGPHVAPPASANAGTGRATLVDRLRSAVTASGGVDTSADLLLEAATAIEVMARDWQNERALYRLALASEHQRGLAEGERIGIEKAAKAADDIPAESYDTDYLFGWAAGRHSAAAAIRALAGDPQT